ncbi:MAG: hypothetical protein ABR928_18420 [Terracidiphilus sp.]|jgi:hypothetical protein
MKWMKSITGKAAEPQPDLELNPELRQALQNFRQSVHAWSDAEINRPRSVRVAADSAWRPALAWALGCVVIAGGVSGGLYDHHRVVVERQQAAARIAHERQLAEQQKLQQTDESLLANVDTDISRSVPAAMEPLAQLMEDNGSN